MDPIEDFTDYGDGPDKDEAVRRSTSVSVVANCGLTAMQVSAGLISGFQGLVADGIHSLSELVADFVVLVANAWHDLMVEATLSVEAGHDIAVAARSRVMQRHRVLNVMTHVDPWQRPDRDHAAVVPMTTG